MLITLSLPHLISFNSREAEWGLAAAFDADVAGETMAWRVAQQVPGIERLTPNQGKDWNEVLVRPEGNSWQQSQPELEQLWQWHGAAVALARPEGYLSRITEVSGWL